jgi:hypothetical protein
VDNTVDSWGNPVLQCEVAHTGRLRTVTTCARPWMREWTPTSGLTGTGTGFSTIHSPYYEDNRIFQESSRRAV